MCFSSCTQVRHTANVCENPEPAQMVVVARWIWRPRVLSRGHQWRTTEPRHGRQLDGGQSDGYGHRDIQMPGGLFKSSYPKQPGQPNRHRYVILSYRQIIVLHDYNFIVHKNIRHFTIYHGGCRKLLRLYYFRIGIYGQPISLLYKMRFFLILY